MHPNPNMTQSLMYVHHMWLLWDKYNEPHIVFQSARRKMGQPGSAKQPCTNLFTMQEHLERKWHYKYQHPNSCSSRMRTVTMNHMQGAPILAALGSFL